MQSSYLSVFRSGSSLTFIASGQLTRSTNLQRGEDAEEMRSSLRTFLEQRPLNKVEDMTSRREIAIVSTILNAPPTTA
jgi:hypothetical protein